MGVSTTKVELGSDIFVVVLLLVWVVFLVVCGGTLGNKSLYLGLWMVAVLVGRRRIVICQALVGAIKSIYPATRRLKVAENYAYSTRLDASRKGGDGIFRKEALSRVMTG